MKKIREFINNNEDVINVIAGITGAIAMIILLTMYGRINGNCI